MFVRVKNVGPYQYLQIAQNRRQGKRVKQSVIATLGRLDKLTASGAIDQLLRSAARFAEPSAVGAGPSSDARGSDTARHVRIETLRDSCRRDLHRVVRQVGVARGRTFRWPSSFPIIDRLSPVPEPVTQMSAVDRGTVRG